MNRPARILFHRGTLPHSEQTPHQLHLPSIQVFLPPLFFQLPLADLMVNNTNRPYIRQTYNNQFRMN